ncbi:hypothetical protein [Limosilactobacillus sp.]|uniref:hypothetical protein n=1 Tax=Limosilactobacillus sp. TaxID=2773925 RepID=UPI00345E85EB
MKAQKVLTSTVMLMAALGLAGCAKNSSAPATNESHVRSAKVAKANSHKAVKTDKTAKNAKNDSKASSASTSVASSNVASSSQSNSNVSANSQSKQSEAKATAPAAASSSQSVTANSKAASSSSVTAKNHSEAVQLGLGDTAVWTDNKGVTHHVNSDGLDKQTTQNSNAVSYSDWSGNLPQGVKVEHN